MVTEIRIHFEGDQSLREGFHWFLGEIVGAARARKITFRLIACKGTPQEDFALAKKLHPNTWNILLKDSEGPISSSIPDDSKFFMVEMMEAWFLADFEALEHYYGQGFRRNSLDGNPKVEEISKRDVISRLHEATKQTSKGTYHKTKHAPQILASIDPSKVRGAAPNCERFFNVVLARLNKLDD